MAAATLSHDVLLMLGPYLREKDLLNLGMTRQNLNRPLTLYAIQKALLEVPSCKQPKPVVYAIKNGDIQLLSLIYDCIVSPSPNGEPEEWKWPYSHHDGTARAFDLAASSSAKSLQSLVQICPLWAGPADSGIPKPVLAHGLYSLGYTSYDADCARLMNTRLVNTALIHHQYDCVSFLLDYNKPPLFPGGIDTRPGIDLRPSRGCYASATGLQLLIDHGARLDEHPLHVAAAINDLSDPRIFDVLVQSGYKVDSTLPIGEIMHNGNVLTPLYTACYHLAPRNMEALLRLGANPDGADFSITKLPLGLVYVYVSPNPILALLLSYRLDPSVWQSLHSPEDFISCFQLLLRHGATTSIPLPDGDIFEILLLRIWHDLRCLLMFRVVVQGLKVCGYDDGNVESLLSCISRMDVSPWEEMARVVHEAVRGRGGNAGQASGKSQLVGFFRDYQARRGDLSGPIDMSNPYTGFQLPERFGV